MPARTGTARRARSLPAAARAAHPWVGACPCGAQGFRFAPARRMIGAGPRGTVAQAEAHPPQGADRPPRPPGRSPGRRRPWKPLPAPACSRGAPPGHPPAACLRMPPGQPRQPRRRARRMRPHVPAACRDGKNACPRRPWRRAENVTPARHGASRAKLKRRRAGRRLGRGEAPGRRAELKMRHGLAAWKSTRAQGVQERRTAGEQEESGCAARFACTRGPGLSAAAAGRRLQRPARAWTAWAGRCGSSWRR